jgi:hypothetical protein
MYAKKITFIFFKIAPAFWGANPGSFEFYLFSKNP